MRSTCVKIQLPKRRGELLYGFAPCLAALQAKRRKIYSIFTQDGFEKGNNRKRHLKELLSTKIQFHSNKHDIKPFTLSNTDITRLVGKKPHQGIVLDVEPLTFKSASLTGSLNKMSKQFMSSSSPPLWLMLYQIQDPMNFGAILRCAYFLGVDKILVSSKNSCSLTSVVSKASSGAMELAPVHSVQDVPLLLKQASSQEWAVLGACSGSSNRSLPVILCEDAKLEQPTILVLGNEGYGLPSDVISVCTSAVTIPTFQSLPPGFDSLNVSVAAGILLHSLKNNCKNL